MSLTPEVQEIIRQEEETLSRVMSSLKEQIARGAHRYYNEAARARELTAGIVAARKSDDKVQLISDEAVSHQITNAKRKEIRTLDKQLDRPYFARIILEEQRAGKTTEIEYKLGSAANPDCRIIDWRKAPIAKLYYEYKEGEEYAELILGQERQGIVKLRNKLEIDNGQLQALHCRYGRFVKTDGSWQAQGLTSTARSAQSYRQLPDVLSLITAEQFRLITEDSTSAVLIQGIAGSGKTTVALYRLAWLLHERAGELNPENTSVLVLSKVLRNYIASSLSPLNLEDIKVQQFDDWVTERLKLYLPQGSAIRQMLAQPRIQATPGANRLKRSLALAALVAELSQRQQTTPDVETPLEEQLLGLLNHPQRIINHDEFGLIDSDLINQVLRQTKESLASGRLDYNDPPLLLRLCQIRAKGQGNQVQKQGHIVADEVQDLSAVELDAIIGEVEDSSQLTLVGDIDQQLNSSVSGFPGWERLQKHRALDDKGAVFSKLTVSHRCSLPIMRLADHISGSKRTTDGRPGKVPIWFHCRKENAGVSQAIGWLNRVLERFPGSLAAVICRTDNHARIVHSMLEPTFGSAVSLGDESGFTFSEGILVCGVREAKGLEFAHVLIWNPDSRTYSANQSSRNRLYVATTRAQEHLCLVSWGQPSPLLPNIYSKLVRGYEPDRPEPEND